MNKKQQEEFKLLLARLQEFVKNLDVRTVRETRIEAGLLTQGEVAKLLGMNLGTLRDNIQDGRLPPPTRKTAGGRLTYYSPADVEELRAALAALPGRGPADVAARRRAHGFYSRPEVAALCGVSLTSLKWHEGTGRIQPPKRRYPTHDPEVRYYSEGEAQEIVRVLTERNGIRRTGKRGRRPVNSVAIADAGK